MSSGTGDSLVTSTLTMKKPICKIGCKCLRIESNELIFIHLRN